MTDAYLDPDLEPVLSDAIPLAHIFTVFLSGALGTLARYFVIKGWIFSSSAVPWNLVFINASGSFVLGLLTTSLFTRRPDLVGVRLACSTGFLGGWTTYSSYAVTVLLLAHHGAWWSATWLVVATALGGPVVAWLGRRLGDAVMKVTA